MESGDEDWTDLPDPPDGGELGPPTEDRTVRRIVAVGGGKGGAGKSFVAANLAIFLATLNRKVVLFDADLGGANLHSFVGVERPTVTLADFLERRVRSIEDVVLETPIPGLGLVSGEGGPPWIANPRPAQKNRIIKQLGKLDADFLIIDLGAGSGFNALDFFLAADVGLLVVVPEPTSIENNHRFIKTAFLRHLKRFGLEKLVDLGAQPRDAFEGGIPGPRDLVELVAEKDPEAAERLLGIMRRFRPRILLNQVRSRSDAELGRSLVVAARRRLGIPIDQVGHLEYDDMVLAALRRRRPLLVEYPESRVARGIERVARRLAAADLGDAPLRKILSQNEQSHYEILDVDPSAPDEEIRRAARRAREVYSPDSIVVAGLYNQERLESLHLRIEEAYATLMDADRRKQYDRATFPDGATPRERPTTPASGMPVPREVSGALKAEPVIPVTAGVTPERPPLPTIDATTDITGALLRQQREARGIDIHTISETTKIGVNHLRDIEDERFDRLPAPVYVRGFLKEVARCIGLDAERVMATYLERFKVARSSRDAGELP